MKQWGWVSKAREIELLEEIIMLNREIEYLEGQMAEQAGLIEKLKERGHTFDLNAKLQELGERYKTLFGDLGRES